jgi:phosphoserine aminotransferase
MLLVFQIFYLQNDRVHPTFVMRNVRLGTGCLKGTRSLGGLRMAWTVAALALNGSMVRYLTCMGSRGWQELGCQ